MRVQTTQPQLDAGFVSTPAHKVLAYDGDGLLATVTIYTDATETAVLYTKTFTYTTGLLTRVTTVRAADGATFTKDLAYDAQEQLQSTTTA